MIRLGPLLVWLLLAALTADAVAAQVEARRKADGTLELISRAAPTASARALRRVQPPRVLAAHIEAHARTQRLDPRLVESVIQVESAYDARAVSHRGAIGLMQLMPATAAELGVDPWDPFDNLRGGITYLRVLLDRFGGDLELALAGYNAGPGAVERYRGLPPYRETTDYVSKVLGLYRSRGGASLGVPSVRRGRPVTSRRDANGRLVLSTP